MKAKRKQQPSDTQPKNSIAGYLPITPEGCSSILKKPYLPGSTSALYSFRPNVTETK